MSEISIGAHMRTLKVREYEDDERADNPYIVRVQLGGNTVYDAQPFWLNVQQTEDLITVLQYHLLQYKLAKDE